VTTTADRPSSLQVTALTDPPRYSPPRRSRGRLWRRLPYALAVLALAAGYAIGHSASNPAPKPVASSPTLVTPQQINQALSATNGTPEVNDRGFSQLENGVQHSHGFELPMSAADRKLLSHQVTLAEQTAMRYPTLADAERAGMRPLGPFSPGLGLHVGGLTSGFAYGAETGVMTDAQIEHPATWIYDGTKPDSRVAGLFYSARVQNPAGFAGPNDVWHKHTNICIVFKPGGGINAPLGADHDVTTAQCNAVHGVLIKATGPLLHVWVVPGYEDSQGVFAHLNPAITCNDGTYHTIDTKHPGYVTTACADGTE
jgi:hypothetical protein